MGQPTTDVVERAYKLIEAGNLKDARRLLEDQLEEGSDNADVWWVYAHAVEDIDAAENALNNVLKLDPEYPGARDLMAQLRDVKQEAPESEEALLSEEDLDLEDEELDALLEEEEQVGRGSRRWLFIGSVVVILVIIGAFIVLYGLNQGDDEDETHSASTAVFQAGEEVTPEATPEMTSEPGAGLMEILGDFELAEAGISDSTVMTDIGATQVISVCAEDPAAFLDTVRVVMSNIAENTTALPEAANALAVTVFNCDDNTQLNTIGVTVSTLEEYQRGEITEPEFRSNWRVVSVP